MVERSVLVEEAKVAEELFMAVTTRDIVPIVKFDGHAISQGSPGKVTKALMRAFQQFVGMESTHRSP